MFAKLLFVFGLLTSTSAFALDVKCGSVALPSQTLSYCYADPSGVVASPAANVNVIYFFHGMSGNPMDLFGNAQKNIFDLLTVAYGNKMPLLVTLSIGAEGVFGPHTDEIANAGLAQIEAIVAPGKTLRRTLLGASMGGHNSMRFAAESPKKFAAVAAVCPALNPINGFDQVQVEAYILRHRPFISEDFFRRALEVFKRQMASPAIWDANNPFTYLAKGVYDGLPIYLSVGREDNLGFIEGSEEFKKRADTRPLMKVDFHDFHGPHCVFDGSALVRFLQTNISNALW